jgi:Na+/serine symporter
MDILGEDGFSIIESLLGIVLLGLIVVFTIIIFNNIWNNPGLAVKSEAFFLASREINNTINGKAFTDTSYNNAQNNLTLNKQVKLADDCYYVEVSVIHIPTKKEIVLLSAVSGE